MKGRVSLPEIQDHPRWWVLRPFATWRYIRYLRSYATRLRIALWAARQPTKWDIQDIVDGGGSFLHAVMAMEYGEQVQKQMNAPTKIWDLIQKKGKDG